MDPFRAPPAKQSTAELAATTLWEYQLRRENRAILEQIRNIGEQRDADVANQAKIMQQEEKHLLAIEARLTELEKEQKLKDARAAEHQKECAAKIAEMEKLLRSRLTDGEFNNMMSEASVNVIACSTPDHQTRPAASRPPISQRSAHAEPHNVGERGTTNPAAPIRNASRTAKPMKVANRRPATRSTSSANASSQQQAAPIMAAPVSARSRSSPHMPTPPPLPKLAQKHKTVKQYYDHANAQFQAMAIVDPQTEYDFVNGFIDGLNSKKNREKLIQALEAVHPSKGRLEGGIEIRCEWEDIPDGLKSAGLDITGAQEEIKRKKRTLNPRTQLETGFAN